MRIVCGRFLEKRQVCVEFGLWGWGMDGGSLPGKYELRTICGTLSIER
jgi:hypothetical protein